jgi:TonB family protein
MALGSSRVRTRPLGPWRSSDPSRWKSALENYVPSVRGNNRTALGEARHAFAGYLNVLHNRIHPIFADSFLGSLDALPATYPLNDQQLSTELEIILNQDAGGIERMGVTKSSGITAFDIAALESVKRAAPFGQPPPEVVSPDGNVYFHWEFHRNQEACSTFNARPFLLRAQP